MPSSCVVRDAKRGWQRPEEGQAYWHRRTHEETLGQACWHRRSQLALLGPCLIIFLLLVWSPSVSHTRKCGFAHLTYVGPFCRKYWGHMCGVHPMRIAMHVQQTLASVSMHCIRCTLHQQVRVKVHKMSCTSILDRMLCCHHQCQRAIGCAV